MNIKINDNVAKLLNKDELKELINGLVFYQVDNIIPKFSSRLLAVCFLYSVNDSINYNGMKENAIINEINEAEERKIRRSEINRQNVMKRWNKYNQNKAIDNDIKKDVHVIIFE